MIADILGVSKASVKTVAQLGEPVKNPSERRRKGLGWGSREARQLCGPGLSSLPVAAGTPSADRGPAAAWEWVTFSNSARQDSLRLNHWRLRDAGPPDYPAAQCNAKARVLTYTSRQYVDLLAALDPSWTREETDYLLSLCHEFDLRFHIIWDRYDPAAQGILVSQSRSVEDLKHRYYSLARKLVSTDYSRRIKEQTALFAARARAEAGNEQLHQQQARAVAELRDEQARHPVIKFKYDPAADRERKALLELQSSVTEEQREEERRLFERIKVLSQRLKKEERQAKHDEQQKKKKKRISVKEEELELPSGAVDTQLKPGVTCASTLLLELLGGLPARHESQVAAALRSLGLDSLVQLPVAVLTQDLAEAHWQLRIQCATLVNLRLAVQKISSERSDYAGKLEGARQTMSDVPSLTIAKQGMPHTSHAALAGGQAGRVQMPRVGPAAFNGGNVGVPGGGVHKAPRRRPTDPPHDELELDKFSRPRKKRRVGKAAAGGDRM